MHFLGCGGLFCGVHSLLLGHHLLKKHKWWGMPACNFLLAWPQTSDEQAGNVFGMPWLPLLGPQCPFTPKGVTRGVAVYPVYPPVYTPPLARLETCIHLYTFCAVYPLYTPDLIWWGCRAHLYTPVYPKTCILAVYLLYTCCIPPVYLMEGDVSCIPCIPPL